METSYGGAMVLPSSYVVMDQEEMTYVEGGAWTFNNVYRGNNARDKIINFAIVCGVSMTSLATAFAATAATAVTVVGAISGCIAMLGSLVSLIFNAYNLVAGYVYYRKNNGFRHKGVQVSFYDSISVGVVSAI